METNQLAGSKVAKRILSPRTVRRGNVELLCRSECVWSKYIAGKGSGRKRVARIWEWKEVVLLRALGAGGRRIWLEVNIMGCSLLRKAVL